MFRSALLKLTAAYLGIVMAICMLFSAVLYHFAVNELHVGFYNEYTRWYDAYRQYGLRHPGTPASELALRSHHILIDLIYFNLLVLGVTAVACYILARRTLRPIEAAHLGQKRFTADVSHELRTPLTALRMETEVSLLDPKASAKELRITLSSNLEEVDRMEVLINNLLLLSSMEASKLRTDFQTLDLSHIVSRAHETVAKLALNKHIEIMTDIPGTLMASRVLGDPASLTQLIVILLENAIKYSPSDSTVRVKLSKSKSRLTVSIQDDGSGIATDALPHVFDRFYRADSSRVKEVVHNTPQGFGLGLSLAKLIADLHGAEIIITSTPGKGTSAAVRLPIA